MENSMFTMFIGLLAQGFFSARILVQWVLSERAKRVLSPSLFWVLSLVGSYLLCLYGWLRNDFAIVLGQFISYYIYLWNLYVKGIWKKTPVILRSVLLLTPVAIICFAIGHAEDFITRFLHNRDIPLWLLLFGSAGQLLFTLRFVYQWFYSMHRGESRLPAGFWTISLSGAFSIVTYGIIRQDIVLILGQSFGVIAYIRNLVLINNEKKKS